MSRELRGRFLEFNIDKLLKTINNNGSFGIKLHTKRSQSGIFLEKPPFDYIIIHKNTTTCFDAKESKEEKWYLSNAKPHQIKNLKNCKDNGCDSFFLVYYHLSKKLIKFDVDTIINATNKYLTKEDGDLFDEKEYIG